MQYSEAIDNVLLAPRRLIRPAYHWSYAALLHARIAWSDAPVRGGKEQGDIAIPPARLRYRVGENLSVNDFLETGRRTAENLRLAFDLVGVSLDHAQRVLDFGCGCGRTLRWLVQENGDRFTGVDVDAASIVWCRNNLSGAYEVGSRHPPLAFDSESFDIIYAVSVFTHVTEADQRLWLAEFQRLLRPGGVVLVTIHGQNVLNGLASVSRDKIDAEGFVFLTSAKHLGILPNWYHTAYQTHRHFYRTAESFFQRIQFVDAGMGDQDAVLLQK